MPNNFKIMVGGKMVGIIKDGVFEKTITEAKHLMWKFGGVPAIDATVFHNTWGRFNKIVVKTDKERVFTITADDFNANKKKLDHGYGDQYYCELEQWKIDDNTLPAPFEKKVAQKQQTLL